MSAVVDLRSDTVTRPTSAMRAAMAAAEVGDDVYGDDPTVQRLERRVADDLGFEAALFLPSGTQANLVALMTHCQRGDEYLVGMEAHTYKWEAGGAAVLGSIQPQPIVQAADGSLPMAALDRAVKPDDPHYARTRLLALENTWHGRVLPSEYVAEALAWARSRGLATHLDGARLYNAAVASGVAPRAIAEGFDSVSVCLSKGLGAPVGSVLVGAAAFMVQARRWRKIAGGGMRQSGILAAAGLHALDHHVTRLADDHARAATLAAGLAEAPHLRVIGAHTNMVFIEYEAERLEALRTRLKDAGILANAAQPSMRLVTHLDIDDAGIARTLAAFRGSR